MNQKITLIGLGIMGSAIAELLLANNYEIEVWNRTTEKAKSLVDKGAKTSETLIRSLQASHVVLICVSDYKAIRNIFNSDEVLQILNGKILINLTTGIPSEAVSMKDFFELYNASYLDGSILSFADQMGEDSTTILFSGDEKVFKQSKNILHTLGGNLIYLGNKIGAASALDQTVLSYMYGALTGFFHGVVIAEKEGIDVSLVGKVINNATPGMGHFIQHEAEQIQANNYEVTLSSVGTNAKAVQHIHDTSKDYNLALRFPELLKHYFSEAEKQNLNNEELASLIKIFRRGK